MSKFKVTFSDGHSLEVRATCRDAARNIAYRVENVFAIASIVEAR